MRRQTTIIKKHRGKKSQEKYIPTVSIIEELIELTESNSEDSLTWESYPNYTSIDNLETEGFGIDNTDYEYVTSSPVESDMYSGEVIVRKTERKEWLIQ
jgi:hypothetical protein